MEWRGVLPLLGPIGVVIGFGLAQIPPYIARRRRLEAHWCALRAEMMLVEELVGHLIEDRVFSPLYRLPVDAYRVSYPVLLTDGAVSEEEVKDLGRYFGWVQDINRGLEVAADVLPSDDDEQDLWAVHRPEYQRNVTKAKDLREKYAGPALAVVDRKIAKLRAWRDEW